VVGLFNCAQCQIDCLTCSNAISCTSCEGNRVIDSKQACVCKLGYFDDSVTTDCVSCSRTPYFCESCLFSTCLTCSPQSNRVLISRYCACASGHYALGSSCIGCSSFCTSCSSYTASSCLSCSPGWLLSNQQCVCPPGQSPVGVACQDCHPSCLTCSGPEIDSCLACDPLNNRAISSLGN
jgi:hypothetical protein